MARQAREICEQKVYHVMLRGVNKQQIFECGEDYAHFVRILQRQCGLAVETRPTRIGYESDVPQYGLEGELPIRHCCVYAWCLMGNHVHLLMKETDEPIGDVMKRISSSYVYYYNRKYERVGHLFQERFKSQTVENWEYFLTLLRYIHQNPLKAGLVADLKDYQWCSWNEYIGLFEKPFSSIESVLSRISLQELENLVLMPLRDEDENGLLDIESRSHKVQISDEEVWRILEGYSGAANATQFQALPRPMQKHYLFMAYEDGAGPRTLSRLTGVSYSVVYKATNAIKKKGVMEQCESLTMARELSLEEELWLTYCDDEDFKKYPDY